MLNQKELDEIKSFIEPREDEACYLHESCKRSKLMTISRQLLSEFERQNLYIGALRQIIGEEGCKLADDAMKFIGK